MRNIRQRCERSIFRPCFSLRAKWCGGDLGHPASFGEGWNIGIENAPSPIEWTAWVAAHVCRIYGFSRQYRIDIRATPPKELPGRREVEKLSDETLFWRLVHETYFFRCLRPSLLIRPVCIAGNLCLAFYPLRNDPLFGGMSTCRGR